jgi:hypothetical protein
MQQRIWIKSLRRPLFMMLSVMLMLGAIVMQQAGMVNAQNPGAAAQELYFAANLTDSCRAALSSSAVNPDCGNVDDGSTSFEEAIEKLCSAPADGNPGQYCSTAQMARALAVLSANCTKELASGDEMVQAVYKNWFQYGLSRDITCLKDSETGEYCVLKNMDLPHLLLEGSSQISKLACDKCSSAAFELLVKWEPPVALSLVKTALNASIALLQEKTKMCEDDWLTGNSASQANGQSSRYTVGQIWPVWMPVGLFILLGLGQ